MTRKTAFIIGNGRSREGINLLQFRDHGTIYGCNALYRDYSPDYPVPDFLVAIDHDIIEEIRKSDFPKERFIVPHIDEQFEPAEYNPARPRMNAGMNAMIEAIRAGHNRLICLGFDFLVDQYAESNIYDGTNAYGPETRTSFEDGLRRVKFFEWFAQKNVDVDFIFVYKREHLSVRPVHAPNVTGRFYRENG